MAESVDALVSNTSGATRAGSTPALGTGFEAKVLQDLSSQHFFRLNYFLKTLFCDVFCDVFCDTIGNHRREVFIYSSIQLGQEGFYNLTIVQRFHSFSFITGRFGDSPSRLH